MDIVTLAGIELTPEEAMKYYKENKYLVKYNGIYKIEYMKEKFRVKKIYDGKGLTKRGRFFAFDADQVNRLVEYQLV